MTRHSDRSWHANAARKQCSQRVGERAPADLHRQGSCGRLSQRFLGLAPSLTSITGSRLHFWLQPVTSQAGERERVAVRHGARLLHQRGQHAGI